VGEQLGGNGDSLTCAIFLYLRAVQAVPILGSASCALCSKIATMFREHELLDTPEDDTILWRYLDLSYFYNLLDRQTLYFANRREFIADPWEGAIPATTTEAAKRVDRYLSELYTELRGNDVSKRKGPNTVTAYVLQQIQLLAVRERHGVAMQVSTRTLVNGCAVTGLLLKA
jgi:hypothetical protein